VDEQYLPLGPLADEAMRLVGAVHDWSRQTFPPPSADEHGGPECRWCPLCQFVAVLRGERPEVSARVAEAGSALATALRAFVDAASSTAQPAQASRSPRVQRINLGEPEP